MQGFKCVGADTLFAQSLTWPNFVCELLEAQESTLTCTGASATLMTLIHGRAWRQCNLPFPRASQSSSKQTYGDGILEHCAIMVTETTYLLIKPHALPKALSSDRKPGFSNLPSSGLFKHTCILFLTGDRQSATCLDICPPSKPRESR